jgi:transcription antitermination protein NusB
VSKEAPAALQERFWRMARADKTTRAFADLLFEGAVAAAPELDELVSKHTDNWRIERISSIDRAILRLGVHELRSGKTPPKVVITEAIKLAKEFSSEDAAPFVNGVLDSVSRSFLKDKSSQ